ncbi:MAG: membrane integrity-associated transporter subunit PqiC [Deltaproteobacteria bacterium]|jgi:uncharacterized lipoprotein YmbA|nr:membrane integrity-associated transporter subunit PqiC [Deltaproteobacteria bacterium]
MEKRFTTPVLIFLVALALWGCLGEQKPPPEYYMLYPGPSTEFTRLEHGMAIGIGPFTVAPHLNRLQIVTRESNTRLRMSEAHQWAAPLKDAIYNVLAVNLAAELNTNRIYEVPSRQKRTLQYRVGIDILQLAGELGGEVKLVSRWVITSGDGKRELISHISRIIEPTGTNDYEAYVEAQSRALIALSKKIAEAIKAQM